MMKMGITKKWGIGSTRVRSCSLRVTGEPDLVSLMYAGLGGYGLTVCSYNLESVSHGSLLPSKPTVSQDLT